MSDITKKDLRELAEKATRGPWWIDSHGHRMSTEDGRVTVFIADDRMGKATRHPETGNLSHWPNDWDASFIASANPKTVIGLLDEIEALEAENARLRAGQEPVASISWTNDDPEWKLKMLAEPVHPPIVPLMLYTTPQPSAVPGDADNYRWLRDQHNNVNSDIGVYDGANILATQEGELDLDAAIAAARKEDDDQ